MTSRPNHPPPTDPLTAEERALAERLARSAPSRLPPASVDTAILRAAHAAAQPPATPRRRPRWPALVGIAATLVLAIGVAWQLRPVGEAPQAQGEHAPAMVRAPAPTEEGRALGVIGPGDAAPEAVPPSDPPVATESVPYEAPVARRAPVPAPEPVSLPAPPAPAVADEPAVVLAPPPPPAPPAPPAAASAPASSATTASTAADQRQQVARKAAAYEQAAAMQRRTPLAAVRPAPAVATITVADLPPSNDPGLPPDVWIERIRQRRDAGRIDDARASLALLRDAHPDLALPDDLRALAADAPPAP